MAAWRYRVAKDDKNKFRFVFARYVARFVVMARPAVGELGRACCADRGSCCLSSPSSPTAV
jgi:hypothetical protein